LRSASGSSSLNGPDSRQAAIEPRSRTRASVDVLALDAASSRPAIARGVASSAAMACSARSPCSRLCNLAAVSAVAAVATSCAHALAAARDVTSPNAAPSGDRSSASSSSSSSSSSAVPANGELEVVFFFFFPVLDRALAALDGDDREDDGLRSVEGVPSPRATRSMGTRRMAWAQNSFIWSKKFNT